MHAVLVAVTIDPDYQDKAQEHLRATIVPMVKELPGAVAGYWLAPSDGHGYSTTVFESEEHAKAAADGVAERAPEFITINHVEIREIIAHF